MRGLLEVVYYKRMIEKPEELFVGYVAQKAVIEEAGEVLFVKGHGENAKWDLPGGRIHKDEEPKAGLLRELREEIGVACTLGEVITVLTGFRTSKRTPFYFIAFAAQLVDDASEIIIADDELSDHAWLSPKELTSDTVYRNCVTAVETYLS